MVVACGGDPTPTPKPAAAPAAPKAPPTPAPKTLKVGFTVPMSGTYAVWGRLASAMECAADELNSDGSLGTTKMKILPEDSKADQAECGTGLRKLANIDKTPVVMTIFTGIGLAQKPVAEELEVVLFSSGIQNPKFAAGSDWVFRNALNTRWNADAVVRYLQDHAKVELNGLKFAIIKEDGNDSIDLQVERLKVLFEHFGVDLVALETFEKGDTKFDTQVTKVKRANPDVVYHMALGSELGYLINTEVQMGLNPKFRMSGGGAEGNVELIRITGKASNGLLYSAPAYNPGGDARTKRFIECYSAKEGGDTPDTYAAAFYDGALTIGEAIKLGADPEDAHSIKDKLATIDFIAGISGRWDYLDTGDAWAPVSFGQVQDGKFVKIVNQLEVFPDIN